MNVSSQHHISARTKRATATVAVAPVTRAIRAALAVSATMLALSAPAMAGTCSHATTPSYSLACNGGFVQAEAGLLPPVDLTRVEGAHAPDSVIDSMITAMGGADWASDVSRPHSLDSEAAASIATWDLGAVDDLALVGDELLAVGTHPTLQIDNTNPIDAYSASGDATGLYAGGGDNSISNSSSIHADGYSSATGVRTWGDYVRVDNSGSIVAEAASSGSYVPVIGVRASGYDARVYNDPYGLISATSSTDANYGWARARGVYATGYFDGVTVGNDGDIQAHAQADNGRAEAHGIYAFGYGSPTTVTNAGDIEVSAVSANGGAYATGINAIGYGSGANNAEVVNTGSILAEADAAYAYAFGALNLTRQRYGNAYLSNDGDIHAEATGNYTTATGSLNLALRYGDAVTINTGSIEAVANGVSAASATGVFNYALVYDAVVDNSGVVSATADGDVAVAVGIYNQSVIYGYTTTVNSGSVNAHAYGDTLARAAGVVGMSEYMVDVSNYGDVDVTASAVDGTATAAGLYALSYQATTVRNYGDVSASAESVYGDAIAYGAFAFGGFSGTGLLINGGSLSAEATAGDGATAYAAGAIVMADVATIFNDASMSATATAGTGGAAYATGARTYGLYSALNNYGDLVASASSDGGTAMAVGAQSYGYLGNGFYNAGDIQATAQGGTATAIGTYAIGIIFNAEAGNTGTISAQATGDSASATGLLNAAVYLGDAIVTNSGNISAVADGGIAAYGEVEATAVGVYNFALFYDSVVDNSGSISATASATTDISGTYGFLQAKAIGAQAVNGYGYLDALVVNSGDIGAAAVTSQGYASAWGAVAQSTGVYGGAAAVDNSGSIRAYGHADVGIAYATGAYALNLMGIAEVVNHGDIAATARVETGRDAGVLNYVYATGIKALSLYGGDASVANYGNIEAHSSALGGITGARGIQTFGAYSSVVNAAGASITAIGEADLWGAGRATGIEASGVYGVDVTNDGDVVAYGHSHGYSYGVYETHYSVARATGVYAGAGFQGDVSVVNNGDITAVAIGEDSVTFFNGGAGAVGIDTYAKYDATIVNAGDITATADSEFGIVVAYGAVGHGKYNTHIVNEAGANIIATASVGSLYSDYYGGRAFSSGIRVFGSGMEQGTVYNAGSIVSHATVTADGGANAGRSRATAYGASIGAYSSIANATMVNVGDIEAVARADFGYATAYGSFAQSEFASSTSNTGVITSVAAAADGDAWAVGSFGFAQHRLAYVPCDYNGCDYSNITYVVDGGDATLDNSGDIVAMASAQGGVGHSYGAVMLGAMTAGIANAGRISAYTEADDAVAVGVLANSFYGNAALQNSGAIEAMANGDLASATGAEVIGSYGDANNGYLAATVVNQGDIVAVADGATTSTATGVKATGRYGDGVQIDNAGTIAAAAYGATATATAVSMDSIGSNTLTNTGTIGAFGDGARIAVYSGMNASAIIANSGSITGAIVTGNLDDSFDNATGATWNAVGESNFGAGTDRIVNNGAIFMSDATILMDAGATVAPTASFAPMAIGVGSTFENAGTLAVSGTSNAVYTGTFYNNGTISFVDGAPDDVLIVNGDFTGEGTINLDVSPLNQSADQLYIDGNVIEPTVQTVNVNLVDTAVNAPSTSIALVNVSGDSLASDFVLGNVLYTPGGFLALDFGLNTSIDAAGDDVFSLGVDVTGLNGAGSLAAAVAPGAASLADAQIGTWHQRMGVMPEKGRVGLSSWMRWFTSSGDVEAQHEANFGAGGTFGFHQSNSGWELGLDYRPNEHLAFGLLLGKSEGNQRLDGGLGSDRFDGSSFGLYGTWTGSNGFYVDLSHRRMDVDARLRATSGAVSTSTTANSLNVETGFTAWTLAGVNVTPQLQYTRTRIDDIELQDAGSTFAIDGGTSSRARLGVAFDKRFQTNAGYTLTPYGSLNVVRESDGDYSYAVNDGLLGATRTEGSSAMLELGLGTRKGGLSLTGGVNWTDGGAQQGVVGGQLVLRYGW